MKSEEELSTSEADDKNILAKFDALLGMNRDTLELLLKLSAQKGGIGAIQWIIGCKLASIQLEKHLAAGNLLGVRECLQKLQGINEDMWYDQVFEVTKKLFQDLQTKTQNESAPSLATCLNVAIHVLPIKKDRDPEHERLAEFDTFASTLIPACLGATKIMRKICNPNMQEYSIFCQMIKATILRMSPRGAISINESLDGELIKIPRLKVEIKTLYDWCIEIGFFDENECHDISLALGKRMTKDEERRIRNALNREKTRRTRIIQRLPPVLSDDGDEDKIAF